MKKMRQLFCVFLFSAIFLTACGSVNGINGNKTENAAEGVMDTGEEAGSFNGERTGSAQDDTVDGEPSAEDKLLEEQKKTYADAIEALDDLLAENRGREQKDDFYQETIGTIYLFSEAYTGVLQAGYDGDGVNVLQIGITDAYLEEKQRYECRQLSDDSLWFTYQTESVCERDLPDYIVNEDALRYSRVDYVYDDGQTDVEEEREIRRQKADEYLADETGGKMQEFWCRGDRMYRIDRAEGVFIDVTEDKEICIADFLREQLRRIPCQLSVSEASLEVVEKYKPKGYSLLHGKNAWDEIAVSDLNHDGRMDYVAVLYPDDYEEVRRYADWSPYEHSSQYYAASFWLLLSSEDGGYEQIPLSDSIEYWDTALVLTEVIFLEEDVLQLEYFVGRSPYTNALLRFQYDEEEKDFYVLSSYYRDAFDGSLLIGDAENYGRTSMSRYFGGTRQNYCEGSWQYAKDVVMGNGVCLSYYSDSFQYACENLPEEHHINALIWEREYELLKALGRHDPDGELSVMMDADAAFYNRRLVSGQVELTCRGDRAVK